MVFDLSAFAICWVSSLIFVLFGVSMLRSDIQIPKIRIGVDGGCGFIDVFRRLMNLSFDLLFEIINLVFEGLTVMSFSRKNSSAMFVKFCSCVLLVARRLRSSIYAKVLVKCFLLFCLESVAISGS